jgi:hypothetical protein
MASAALKRDVLYERDETQWLELMSDLIREGRLDEADFPHLAEYLADMARRDRREVSSRLAVLIAQWLKWRYQPDRRSTSWRATVEIQRQELAELLESEILRNHAVEILPRAYANGVRQAVAETGLPETVFPSECPDSLEALLSEPLADDPSDVSAPRDRDS